jgi:alpha-methylacyl-CoA racemase
MQRPLGEMLVVELTRYLPGAFATTELLRLGARVVRVEQPGGDPMRETAAGWHDALNAGKESVVCDLPGDAPFLRGLLGRADVVLETFRPGVLARLGVRPQDLPGRAVVCSITGFGAGGRHEQRAGHDLNYQGWAGVLHDTAPGWPPVQVADLAAGSLGAVNEILAALLTRERTGAGARLTVSMTHGTHRLASFRLAGDPRPRLLTGGLACYRTYATADGRHLTVGALEPKFFVRLCELIGRPELSERQYAAVQEPLAAELARVFSSQPLEHWLSVFDNEDVCVGPVATLAEAAADLGTPTPGRASELGAHTESWRRELGL